MGADNAVIIIVGIRMGLFTPTEGGVVAAVYAIVVGKFIYKGLDWSDFPEILSDATCSTAVISFLIATASLFGWLLASEQIPQQISETMLRLFAQQVRDPAHDQRPSDDRRHVPR